jgi:ABC-type transporter Mla MlaB component
MSSENGLSGERELEMSRNVPVEGRLVLTGEATLQSIESIHSRLLEMAGQPTIEIDCNDVTEVDVSLIQLILAARSSAHKSGRSLVLARPASGPLQDALQRGGFLGADTGQPNPDQAFWTEATGM